MVIAEHSGPAAWDITLKVPARPPDKARPSCCAKPMSRRWRTAYRSNSDDRIRGRG